MVGENMRFVILACLFTIQCASHSVRPFNSDSLTPVLTRIEIDSIEVTPMDYNAEQRKRRIESALNKDINIVYTKTKEIKNRLLIKVKYVAPPHANNMFYLSMLTLFLLPTYQPYYDFNEIEVIYRKNDQLIKQKKYFLGKSAFIWLLAVPIGLLTENSSIQETYDNMIIDFFHDIE